MGRMADARKRAKRRAAEPAAPGAAREPAPEPAAPSREPGAAESEASAPAPRAEPASAKREEAWIARDEPIFFPDETAAPERNRISLPSSGLASEILARADAAAVTPAAVPPEAAPPGPPAPASGGALVTGGAPRAELSPRSHNVSFFAAPAREERKAAEATEHLATFFLGSEEYGVDVRLVQEIIRVSEITPVPRAPASIKGVINLRGRIIPVVDLKRKLSLGDVEPTRLSRIVVVKARERLIGLLVDGASQVLKVPVSTIEAAPAEVMEIDASYIRGVAKLPERLIILMDLLRILSPELKEATEEAPA
jgi:purine-binding chemotaxis protein CheW